MTEVFNRVKKEAGKSVMKEIPQEALPRTINTRFSGRLYSFLKEREESNGPRWVIHELWKHCEGRLESDDRRAPISLSETSDLVDAIETLERAKLLFYDPVDGTIRLKPTDADLSARD